MGDAAEGGSMDTAGADVRDILERHRGRRGMILSVLQEVQDRWGYLPEKALREIAEETGRSPVDLYAIATFYRAFSLDPRGKHLVSVCLGTACHVRGAPAVAEEFERQLKVQPGHTTPDGEFTLETVNCLGACALGPIVVADGRYYSRVKPAQVKQILRQTRAAPARSGGGEDPRVFPVDTVCPRCRHDLMDPAHPLDGRPSIGLALDFGGRRGWLRLSSLYGSPRFEAEFEVPTGAVAEISCPHCRGGLADDEWLCPECGAPMASLAVPRGATGRLCARRGCRGHMLDLNGMTP